VRDEERGHLVGRVVMNPMGRLRDADDARAGDPVSRGIGEHGVEVLLLVTPNDERRDFHLGPRESPADAVPEARSIPVDGGTESPWRSNSLEQVVDVLGREAVVRERPTYEPKVAP
jgi:hypothetical protein